MSNLAEKQTAAEFPVLTDMGIRRVHEISHYTLQQEDRKHDVLKVYYKRAKGSLLPESRKYRFGRSLKTTVGDGGTSRFEDHYEISPVLGQALAELDRLSARHESTTDAKTRLVADLVALESEVTQRIADLRAQLDRL